MSIPKYLVAALCILFSQGSIAQNNKEDILTFTGGLSYATYGSVDLNADWKEGYFFGVRRDAKLVSVLFVNFGLIYSQQGAIVNQEDLKDIDYKTGYLDIPVGLKLKLGPLFLTGGVTGNVKIEDNFDSIDNASEIDGFDMAYSVGLGFKISVVSLDIRWNNSFSETGDISLNDAVTPVENSYFLVGLGISIHKK